MISRQRLEVRYRKRHYVHQVQRVLPFAGMVLRTRTADLATSFVPIKLSLLRLVQGEETQAICINVLSRKLAVLAQLDNTSQAMVRRLV